MATLRDLVVQLDSLDAGDRFEVGPAIYARPPWTADSEAELLKEDHLDSRLRPGLRHVLSVGIAQEVLRVWSDWRSGASPTTDEAVAAVLHYATHDAYQPLEA